MFQKVHNFHKKSYLLLNKLYLLNFLFLKGLRKWMQKGLFRTKKDKYLKKMHIR